MIIVMKPGFTQEELNEVVEAVESRGAAVDKIEGLSLIHIYRRKYRRTIIFKIYI